MSERKLTFMAAAIKYDIPEKTLAGHCLRNDMEDPVVVDKNDQGEYLVLDDWRLQKLAERIKAK